VLVNEFGKVGIDQAVLGGDDVAIKEVPGGCLCCANHLPLQVALSQLLTRAQPSRVLIEPTGLGHPSRVLESLRSPHWREALSPHATLTLVDARDLADARVREHETFRAQVDSADVLVFSKDDALTETDRDRARAFAASLLPPKAHVYFLRNGALPREWLDLPARPRPLPRSLLHLAPNLPAQALTADAIPTTEPEPPYHYSEALPEAAIAGWVFPRHWIFRHDELLNALFTIDAALRIKGIFHTDRGWIFFNATRHETAINSETERTDSRLEIIAPAPRDWLALEKMLLAVRVK
jgi:G3E family GTPase